LDVEYLVDQGEVKIVDEFTGRVLEGRRYSEGLHQAIEAKEGVKIKEENQTLATITLQNYFRLYEKLAGMTGTAETEAAELAQIYGLEVMVIPPNRPVARSDHPDLVYKTEDAKFDAVVEDVAERHGAGQPILLGTVSIEKSERLSRLLTKRGINHEVLNAKHHAREAEIIAQAGRPGAVTVATNMAGRGVDIMLGGNPEGLAKVDLKRQQVDFSHPEYESKLAETTKRFAGEIAPDKERVIEVGGLYVVGTERHESRRIDNQLRGRSGRQGDPGESRFFLSLGDDLMRRFSGDRVSSVMDRLKIPDDVPIEAGMVTKAIERAQRTVEAQNFDIRKNVLKYDEVMNRQREVIYDWRTDLLDASADDLVEEWVDLVIAETVESVISPEISPKDWDWELLNKELGQYFQSSLSEEDFADYSVETVTERAIENAHKAYAERLSKLPAEARVQLEQQVVLSVIDNKWREHLSEMDYLRSGIGLRAMGQRDPLVEYQREAYTLFSELVESVKRDTVRYLFHVQFAEAPAPESPKLAPSGRAPGKGQVGRNDPCPCGSGKKFKRCHGAS
ncbi:MAG TPA: SEC-C metal-binding domain-containing protein, partial [Acidimicrobiia bacterium]|nr:SEC-C metal-binding domain-containing protein [Acidimicrobiia bacterium]